VFPRAAPAPARARRFVAESLREADAVWDACGYDCSFLVS
jgi:hypothetical protein